MGAIGDEVVAPRHDRDSKVAAGYRIRRSGRGGPFRLPVRYFQPLATPNALDPFGIHRPTLPQKQGGDAAVSIATVVRGQSYDTRRQALLVGSWL